MKNMILGMMGSLILINTLCICLCLLKYSPGVRAMRIQEKQIVEELEKRHKEDQLTEEQK